MRPRWKAWGFFLTCLGLLVLAMYQMTQIFWGSGENYKSSNQMAQVQPDTSANLMKPQEIFISSGSDATSENEMAPQVAASFGRIGMEQEPFEAIFEQCYSAIVEIMQETKKPPVSTQELPFGQAAIVFSYWYARDSYLMSEQLLLQKEFPEEGNWTQIWLVPAKAVGEKTRIYWINEEQSLCLVAEGSGFEQPLNTALIELMIEEGLALEKEYIMVTEAWSQWLQYGGFRAEKSRHEKAYSITAGAAFPNEEEMQTYAMRFFEYPETVTVRESGSGLLFSNEKKTVRVDTDGRVQYVETLTDAERQKLPMHEAYQLAYGFLTADLKRLQKAVPEVVLSGYHQENDRYVFTFSYVINGTPYRMDKSKQVRWHMGDAVQITIEGSKVRRYERYVMDIAVKPNSQYELRTTWLDAASKLTQKRWTLQSAPRLVYYSAGNSLVPKWEAQAKEGRAWLPAN